MSMTERGRIASALDLVATVAVIMVSVVTCIVLLSRGGTKPTATPARLPSAPLSLSDAALLGNVKAKVAVVMFSDFQCPYCAKFAKGTLPEIVKAYIDSGRVLLAFRHLPLRIHEHAQKAAEGAECAGRQGAFWKMHDLLFVDPAGLDEEGILNKAVSLGLDVDRFRSCFSQAEMGAKVRGDADLARSLEVTGTPTFFFGTVQPNERLLVSARVSGAMPIDRFSGALDSLLRSK